MEKLHAEKINGSTSSTEKDFQGVTAKEKADYELFTNGNLPRETLAKWVASDLGTVAAFVQHVMTEKTVFDALVDAMYSKYLKVHENNDRPTE